MPNIISKSIKIMILLQFIVNINFAQDRTIGLLSNDTNAYDGFTLFAPKHNTVTYLINNEGRKIHEWTACEYEPGQSVYLQIGRAHV